MSMKLFEVNLLVSNVLFWKSENKDLFYYPPLTPPKGGDLWNLFSDFHRLIKMKRFRL